MHHHFCISYLSMSLSTRGYLLVCGRAMPRATQRAPRPMPWLFLFAPTFAVPCLAHCDVIPIFERPSCLCDVQRGLRGCPERVRAHMRLKHSRASSGASRIAATDTSLTLTGTACHTRAVAVVSTAPTSRNPTPTTIAQAAPAAPWLHLSRRARRRTTHKARHHPHHRDRLPDQIMEDSEY